MKLVEGRMPDRQTSYGRAWRADLSVLRKLHPEVEDATLVMWVVEALWAHPFWGNYCVACVHLRPTRQLPNPVIRLEGATHEVWVYALDPDKEPSLVNPFASRLEPVNFVGQWISATDIEAEEKINDCVDDILAGQLSPDTDYRQLWVARFSDSHVNQWLRGNDSRR